MNPPGRRLTEFFGAQFPEYRHIPFEDEIQTQFLLHIEPNVKKKIVEWIKTFKVDMSHKSVENSDNYREDGNRLFRENKKLNALAASRLYTSAIFLAPDGSRSLALAHANRSAALTEFGYYQEAFEDCQCAMDYGYPDENLQKIMIRQAYCASKLEDPEKLEGCLRKLRDMTLSPPFAKQMENFEQDLIRLQENEDLDEKPVIRGNYMDQTVLNHPVNGRYMVASKDIAKNEEILIEKVFSLVAVEYAKICATCASHSIIPFPCNNCSKVYYCSLKCKRAQEMVHRFECYAHRCGFLDAIGITHLAMNTLLNGLPSIIPYIKDGTSTFGLWRMIENIRATGDKGYAEVLGLVTNLPKLEPNELRSYSLAAAVLCFYLKEFTAFFTLFEGCHCGPFEWGVVVSALLLRHTNQLMSNAQSCLAMVCLDTSYEFYTLTDIWDRPQHLKKGLIHSFSRVFINYAAIFPYLSLCNHSCDPSLSTKYEGDYVIGVARYPIKKGEEISNCYMADFRNSLKANRLEDLKSIYRFDCKCKHCSEEGDDSECLSFYKYRCQSSSCEAIFTPPTDNLCWWLNIEEPKQFLTCPVCRTNINLDWYWHFDRLSKDPTEILKTMQLLNFSERILVGCNELRLRMASTAVILFFETWRRGLPLSRLEFKEIGEILNYWLEGIERQNDVESILYIAKATFALDLMAQGEVSYDFDREKIRKSLDSLPLEMRIVFDNYIADYIGDKF